MGTALAAVINSTRIIRRNESLSVSSPRMAVTDAKKLIQ